MAESLGTIDGQQVNVGQRIMVVSHEIKTKSGLMSRKERAVLTEKKQLFTEKLALLGREKESALVKIPQSTSPKHRLISSLS
ncbi:hypothetical protein [Xenorhabdus lircayensis]|nr:hypothetical protein [Xenorhabdus lircayensis]